MNPFGFGNDQPTGRTIQDRNESLVQDRDEYIKGKNFTPYWATILGLEQESLGKRIIRDTPINMKYPGFGYGGGIPLENYNTIELLRRLNNQQEALNSGMATIQPPPFDPRLQYLPPKMRDDARRLYDFQRRVY